MSTTNDAPFRVDVALGQNWTMYDKNTGWRSYGRRVRLVSKNEEFTIVRKSKTIISGLLEIEKGDSFVSITFLPQSPNEICLRFGQDCHRY